MFNSFLSRQKRSTNNMVERFHRDITGTGQLICAAKTTGNRKWRHVFLSQKGVSRWNATAFQSKTHFESEPGVQRSAPARDESDARLLPASPAHLSGSSPYTDRGEAYQTIWDGGEKPHIPLLPSCCASPRAQLSFRVRYAASSRKLSLTDRYLHIRR